MCIVYNYYVISIIVACVRVPGALFYCLENRPVGFQNFGLKQGSELVSALMNESLGGLTLKTAITLPIPAIGLELRRRIHLKLSVTHEHFCTWLHTRNIFNHVQS